MHSKNIIDLQQIKDSKFRWKWAFKYTLRYAILSTLLYLKVSNTSEMQCIFLIKVDRSVSNMECHTVDIAGTWTEWLIQRFKVDSKTLMRYT